ncbi:MAG: hypothetical protein LBI53_05115 [Candidatus Peribacteria bacterium]|jgi:hypothetical protein|nr:hypothetical protein [Candidatus Peribacteria bacterium]
MKKLLIVSLLTAVIILVGCGGKNEIDKIAYNDKLVDLTEQCFVHGEDAMWSSVELGDYQATKAELPKALETCKQAHQNVGMVLPYNNDTDLKDAVAALLVAEITYLETFEAILDFWMVEDELTPEQQEALATIETELDRLEEAVNVASNNLMQTQETFAVKHGYELEE